MSNVSKYNKSRLKLLLKGFIPSLLTLFFKRDNNLVIFNSFHNVQFSDNSKFLFLHMKSHTNKIVKYVINDDFLRNELTQKMGDFFIETNSLKGMFYALKAGTWIINALELPVSGMFLKCRRNVILLTHGVTSKQAGLMEKDVSFLKKVYYAILRTNLSYALTPCPDFKMIVASHFGLKEKQMLVSGYPRFDPLINLEYTKIYKELNNQISILYAPTWRHYADVSLFPFPDFDEKKLEKYCAEKNIIFYLRVHPRFENSIPEEIKKLSCVKLFSGKDYPDINEYLPNFDMMITDYSSIFYDFMVLDRPLFFFMYDYDDYNKNIGLAVDFEKYAVGYKPVTQDDFIHDIDDALNSDSMGEQRRKIREIACGAGNNSERLIRTLKEKKIL